MRFITIGTRTGTFFTFPITKKLDFYILLNQNRFFVIRILLSWIKEKNDEEMEKACRYIITRAK